MQKWMLKNKKADFKHITDKYHVSEVITRLLVNRGMIEDNSIEEYLEGDLSILHSPFSMKDMEKACDIIIKKINEKKKIRIVGDYDVDGVVSTYVLYQSLLSIGANIDYEIPDRLKDGYGINEVIIQAAIDDDVDTILTCDNGIAALEQIKFAKANGITVIVTDHHDIPFDVENGEKVEKVPCADAIVNPKQKDCQYPFKNLCGAGVAYKFIEALYFKLNVDMCEVKKLIQYISIATICDVMDLIGENRIIVKEGLKQLQKTDNIGLKALMEVSNITNTQLKVYHLGFVIGPCLNASGRLDSAKIGLRLLLSKDTVEANHLAVSLKKLNDTRKEMTNLGVNQAVEMIENSGIKEDKVLVIYLSECHESIAGIIAGRIREKYYKPTIVLTDGEESVKGSARSIDAYNMFDELSRCKDLLLKFGGHPLAAGLSLEKSNIDILRQRLNVNTTLSNEDLIEKVSIDVVLPLGYITESLVYELEVLEPFGKGNPKPIFAERDIKIKKARRIGKNNNVLKLQIENQYGAVMDAIYFGDIDEWENVISQKYGSRVLGDIYSNRSNPVTMSIIYYPDVNEYQGMKTLQINVINYQ